MVGYCSKDEGRSHFKTATKGVSRTEVNVALAEYRKMQRANVSENRVEIGKKNFWGAMKRYWVEHLRGLSISPVQLATWFFQDGEGVPSHSWVCPTSAFPMDAARAEAFSIVLYTPALFTRVHAYVLFFSGGQSGRMTTSYEPWDIQDRAFCDMSVDQAKVCSHDRLELEGAMDTARQRMAREVNAFRQAPSCIFRHRLEPDSDSDIDVDVSDSPPPPRPNAGRSFASLGRTAGDSSSASEDLPVIVNPKCGEIACARAGNLGMVSCTLCECALHRSCGIVGGDQTGDLIPAGTVIDFQGRRCSACAVSCRKGKRRASAVN